MAYTNNYLADPTLALQAQAEADELLRLRNRSAPRILEGEPLKQYEKRLTDLVKEGAPNYKDVNIYESSGSAYELIKKQIFDDARKEAKHPTMIPEGQLREVRKLDQSGRPFYEFHGKAGAWMQDFTTGTKKRLVGIRTQTEKGYNPGNMQNIRLYSD